VKQEDALRIEIHQALDAVTDRRLNSCKRSRRGFARSSRRRRFLAIGQVAAVLGILIVGGGRLLHAPIARDRAAPATTSPTTPIVAGPGANNAWVTSQQSSNGAYTGDVRHRDRSDGHVVGRINARDSSARPMVPICTRWVTAAWMSIAQSNGHKEQTIHLQPVTFGQSMLSRDGHY